MIPRFIFLLYPITALVLTSAWGCQGYMNPYLPLTLIDFGIDGCEVVQLSCRGGVGNSVWSLLLLFSLCVYIVLFSEMGRRKNVTQKKKSETGSQIFLYSWKHLMSKLYFLQKNSITIQSLVYYFSQFFSWIMD